MEGAVDEKSIEGRLRLIYIQLIMEDVGCRKYVDMKRKSKNRADWWGGDCRKQICGFNTLAAKSDCQYVHVMFSFFSCWGRLFIRLGRNQYWSSGLDPETGSKNRKFEANKALKNIF